MLSAASAGAADEMGMAILLHMFARHAGLIANELVVVKNNFHCYDRHVDIIKQISENPEYPAPVFWLNPEKTDFYSFTEDDFKLIDYKFTRLAEKIPVAI
jgi:thymidylate synthase